MKIVIDIPKDTYIATCKGCMLPPFVENVVDAIKNATLLPKGHGRLISEDDVLSVILLSGLFDKAKCGEVKEMMSKIPIVLEAEESDNIERKAKGENAKKGTCRIKG